MSKPAAPAAGGAPSKPAGPGGPAGADAGKGGIDMSAVKKANLPIIVIMGGPGCGKGTQCTKIKEKYGYAHLSTGDLLRDDVKKGSQRGKGLEETMKKGDLVPSNVVMDLLKEAMVAAVSSKTKGFLIDGFPRDNEQVEKFTQELGLAKAAILIDCADPVLTKRCLERGKASGRTDDTEAAIKKRIETFKSQTMPVVEFYKKKGNLKIVPGDRELNSVFTDICKILDSK